MHTRRLASFVLGMWLAGGMLITAVVSGNRRAAGQLPAPYSPAAARPMNAVSQGQARLLALRLAAVQNRWCLETWETVQLAGGGMFFLFLLFGTRERKWPLLAVLAMLAIVALQRFLLTPEISALRGAAAFDPEVPSPERARLAILEGFGWGAELFKWGLGTLFALRLILGSRKRPGDSGPPDGTARPAAHRHVRG